MRVGFPIWSADGKYIYFLRIPDKPAVLRIHVSDRKVELVTSLNGLPTTGYFSIFLTLTPDDCPCCFVTSALRMFMPWTGKRRNFESRHCYAIRVIYSGITKACGALIGIYPRDRACESCCRSV